MIQRGAGSLLYRTPHGDVSVLPFGTNDTLVIPPDTIHQAGQGPVAGASSRQLQRCLPPRVAARQLRALSPPSACPCASLACCSL